MRRLRDTKQLPKLIAGVRCNDSIEVSQMPETPPDHLVIQLPHSSDTSGYTLAALTIARRAGETSSHASMHRQRADGRKLTIEGLDQRISGRPLRFELPMRTSRNCDETIYHAMICAAVNYQRR